MIIHLATAAGPLQVGVTSRRQATAPARDAGLTGFAAEGTKSAEAEQGRNDCSDDGRKGDYSKHDGGWKDAKNDDGPLQKDYCDPERSDDCGKGGTYRNPGDALAKFDFSHGDFSSHGPDHSGDMQVALASMSSDDALEYAIAHMGPADHFDGGDFHMPADISHDTDA